MATERGWYVEIVGADDVVDRSIGPFPSERGAERCERGVSINLDHERYSTRVVEKSVKRPGEKQ